MQSETTTAITAVKQDVRLREWAEQLEAQQASGLTVPQWCAVCMPLGLPQLHGVFAHPRR